MRVLLGQDQRGAVERVALPTNSCIDCQRENERQGQAFGAVDDDHRWAKIYEKTHDDADADSHINLSDFEMDLSETGR